MRFLKKMTIFGIYLLVGVAWLSFLMFFRKKRNKRNILRIGNNIALPLFLTTVFWWLSMYLFFSNKILKKKQSSKSDKFRHEFDYK